MESDKIYTPPHYEQPVPSYLERSLNGTQEYVNYIPESHLRIWYNNQSEGYTNHYHNALEIIVCAENQYIIVTNNRTYTLNAGDILMIPPYMLHELRSRPTGARFIYLIDIDILHCLSDFRTLDPALMEPFLCTKSSHSEIYQHVYDSLMQMAEIYFSHKLFWETAIYARLLNIFVTIGTSYYSRIPLEDTDAPDGRPTENYAMFTNLLKFIDAHYADDLTLEQAADYIGFSKYHFTRLFKQHTNTTFHNYLCHKRIQAAQSMLTADMNVPVTDIAFRSGFNNLTTFSRCFNKYTGCSPTEYRNKLREEEM